MDFSKTKVAEAAVNHSKLDVSSTHITTGSFMKLQPVYYRHMLPGEHIKGVGNVLSRLAPVAVPTYGRCRINMRAFFVPFRVVMPNWNEFIVDTIASNASSTSLVPTSPVIPNSVIVNLYTTLISPSLFGLYSRQLDPNDADDAAIIAAGGYDFEYNANYYRFNSYGRWFYKLLLSLGYRPIWNTKDDFNYSALALLSLAKVYLDWYANSAYLNNTIYTDVAQLLKYNDPTSGLVLTYTDLMKIANMMRYINYDSGNDVFLEAWDNPMSPNNGLSSKFSIDDVSMSNGVSNAYKPSTITNDLTQNPYGTPFMLKPTSSSLNIGSEFLHSALKSMTDYVKRNQLSGAYSVDRFLARFGINLDSAKVDRSIYVGATSVDVDFGSVMQTANTSAAGDPSNLGDYAGQGIGRGSLSYDFKCDEFGLFLVTYTIIPSAHIYQGFDRNNLHILKEQFYQPEFDNLGCSAINKGEVYVSKNGSYGAGTDYSGVFGFAPRYYEYKQKSDFVSGDFTLNSIFAGGDSWHLNRIFDDLTFSNVSQQTHSYDFTTGKDAGQFDRIFQYTDSSIDKFYLVFNFAAESLAPCKSLFDTYKFDDLGQQLTLDAGGAKVN